MKHIITITSLLAAGTLCANAYSFTTSASDYKDSNNGNAYVYAWTSSNGGNWTDGAAWDYLTGATAQSMNTTNNWTPGDNNTAVIGYDYAWADNAQTFTSNSTALDIVMSGKLTHGRIYLGESVTLSGSIALGGYTNKAYTFDFGDFGGSSMLNFSSITNDSGLTTNGGVTGKNVKFTGSISMTSKNYSYSLLSATTYSATANWDVSGITVTDACGNLLTYTSDSDKIGTQGYYWLSTTNDASGLKLAVEACGAVPEPSAFGLLAGLGALALAGTRRRRRK
ncbi:MYXO-CTERM sorting domain-containing protein [Candidatus Spyradosoma sp. SGI.093]|uniref:MYXO-CTERM sorting domain-containing protein n=1 Tax=Candidatus Spyradosoma sp. SGI.093 TaxID=3420583 RepID=UPI003D04FB0B